MDKQGARDRAAEMLEAWSRRDYGEIASHLAPEVVLVDAAPLFGRTSTGPAA